MKLEMKMPSPGESITEVEIAQWLVEDGEFVERDQLICEIDSEKATLELAAEESGGISLKAEEGDTVAVGEIVCVIDTSVKGEAKKPTKDKVVEVVSEEKKTVDKPTADPEKVESSTSSHASGHCGSIIGRATAFRPLYRASIVSLPVTKHCMVSTLRSMVRTEKLVGSHRSLRRCCSGSGSSVRI